MRVAVLHHWFVTRGGGERVAECIAALFPNAELFTLVAAPAGIPSTLSSRRLHTSFLQELPRAATHHRHYLPLYAEATERLDLSGFDLVLSSDSGPIKGVRLDAGATHICYCHSPMRYLWDGFDQYRAAMPPVTRALFTLIAPRVRRWDADAGQRVTHFLANSRYVADRIRRAYGREAQVLHPPIDLHRAPTLAREQPSDAYLCAGRLVPYKRTEIAIEACRRLGRHLRIAGGGPELARLRRVAANDSHIEFLGELKTPALWAEYARCRALLFCADEDFGMVPLEAQACGRPVIAYGAGGALETVHANVAEFTGTFFGEQDPDSLAEAILRWESEDAKRFQPQHARDWASGFSTAGFLREYQAFVLQHVPRAASETIPWTEAAAIVS